MMKKLLLITTLLLLSSTAFSQGVEREGDSVLDEDNDGDSRDKGITFSREDVIDKERPPNLKINLGIGVNVKALGWEGERMITVTPAKKEVILDRSRTSEGGVQRTLLLIPRNANQAPKRIQVQVATEKLDIQDNWTFISNEYLWLYGQTPKSICKKEDSNRPDLAFITMMEFPLNKSHSFAGFFAIRFRKRNNEPWLHIFLKNGKLAQLESSAFVPVRAETKEKCSDFFNKECQKVYRFQLAAWGKSHEMNFGPITKGNEVCP